MERREGEARDGREKGEKTKLISGTEGESRCAEECSLTARRDYTRTVPLVLLPWFSESGSDRSMFPTFLSRTGALNTRHCPSRRNCRALVGLERNTRRCCLPRTRISFQENGNVRKQTYA